MKLSPLGIRQWFQLLPHTYREYGIAGLPVTINSLPHNTLKRIRQCRKTSFRQRCRNTPIPLSTNRFRPFWFHRQKGLAGMIAG